MTEEEKKLLAAMVYGESSDEDDADEMYAIASVLVRQRDARGYSDMQTFTASERSFSFVVGDGNPRFAKLKQANDKSIAKDPGMTAALAAAENALKGGADKSNGAFFWDGADIKTNYKTHFKVRHGIKFTDPAHNIYDIKESTDIKIKYKTTRIKVGRKMETHREEIARSDHTYESTAAYGGTIFWRMSPDYLKVTGSKEYK